MARTTHSTFPTTVSLRLLSVDRTDFVYGDYFTYEVLIENTGKQPLTIPWSPNTGEFYQPVPRTPDGFLAGAVSLTVESAEAEPTTLTRFDSSALYGSKEVPRSLLTLEPGRTARIRAPTQFSAAMDQGRTAIFQQPDGEVRLRATFSIYNINFPLTRSTNAIPVRVTRRLPI